MTPNFRHEDGASAVEFALVLIPLLLVLFGTIEFGWWYYHQIALNSAAREGVRELAINHNVGDAEALAEAAFGSDDFTVDSFEICNADNESSLTLSYQHETITPVFTLANLATDGTFTIDAKGVMRCGG